MSDNQVASTAETHYPNTTYAHQRDGGCKIMKKLYRAVSLFSCSGIGDLALRSAGIQTIVANEIVPERAAIFKANNPECRMLVGDIRNLKDQIIETARVLLGHETLDFVFATPPCQGMSKNGRGKLLSAVRKGERPNLDPRNQLILPTLEVIKALQPDFAVFENVSEMKDTVIMHGDEAVNIMELIERELGPEYEGLGEVVEFADFGVPQRRQRLITVFSRSEKAKKQLRKLGTLLPSRTHDKKEANGLKPWVTVEDAIGALEPLDAASSQAAKSREIPLHRVPLLDEDKYFWVANTPEKSTAFDNQCVNETCRSQRNRKHSAKKNSSGINRASTQTPVYCVDCGTPLPRPWVRNGDKLRIMKGYTSAYRRMQWDMPATALTRNLSYACSDTKLHPSQNRVLSLYEALILHTVVDYPFKWIRSDGKKVSDKLIRESIGESIPPRGLEKIFRHLIHIQEDQKIRETKPAVEDDRQPEPYH